MQARSAVVDQPTRVVLATRGFTGLGREDLIPQAFGIERFCDLQTGLLLRGQLEDSSDQLCLYLVDHVSTIDDIESEFRLAPDVLALTSRYPNSLMTCEISLFFRQGCGARAK